MEQIFAIRDKRADEFLNPFIAKNSAVAVRILKELTQNPNTGISKAPEDYELFWIGSYNPEDGSVRPLKEMELVAQAEDYKIEKK